MEGVEGMIGTKFLKKELENNFEGYKQAAAWCMEHHATIIDQGDYYEVVAIPGLSLEEVKEQKLQELGKEFAHRRDAVRWVDVSIGHYGFDCATEDITNFMASWKAAEVAGNTLYKVWTSEAEKGMVTLTVEDFMGVFNAVRQSQYEAYAWYAQKKAEIEVAGTVETVQNIAWSEE